MVPLQQRMTNALSSLLLSKIFFYPLPYTHAVTHNVAANQGLSIKTIFQKQLNKVKILRQFAAT